MGECEVPSGVSFFLVCLPLWRCVFLPAGGSWVSWPGLCLRVVSFRRLLFPFFPFACSATGLGSPRGMSPRRATGLGTPRGRCPRRFQCTQGIQISRLSGIPVTCSGITCATGITVIGKHYGTTVITGGPSFTAREIMLYLAVGLVDSTVPYLLPLLRLFRQMSYHTDVAASLEPSVEAAAFSPLDSSSSRGVFFFPDTGSSMGLQLLPKVTYVCRWILWRLVWALSFG